MRGSKGIVRISFIGGVSALFLTAVLLGCLSKTVGDTEHELIWDEHWESHNEEPSEEGELEVGVADVYELDWHHPDLYYGLDKADGEDCDAYASCDMNETFSELWVKQEVCLNEDPRDRG